MNNAEGQKTLKVAIIGTGFAGMAAAHELVKRGIDVTLIERDVVIGGVAQSREQPLSAQKTMVCEYGWRGYGHNYHHLLNLAKEIPCDCPYPHPGSDAAPGSAHSVFEHIVNTNGITFVNDASPKFVVPFRTANVPKQQRREAYKLLIHGMQKREAVIVAWSILYGLLHSDERLRAMHSIKWSDWVNYKRRSHAFKQVFVHGLWTILGMDEINCSLEMGLQSLERYLQYNVTGESSKFSLTNKPTSRTWFDPWSCLLQKKGARFFTGTRAEKLNVDASGRIVSVTIVDEQSGDKREIEADVFLTAMPVNEVSALCRRSGLPDNTLLRQNPELFSEPMRLPDPDDPRMALGILQKVTTVMIHLDQPMPDIQYCTFLLDTPWMLIIEPLRSFYPEGVYQQYVPTDGDSREITYAGYNFTIPGLKHRRPATDLTIEEIAEEIEYQLQHSSFAQHFKTPPRVTRVWGVPNWRQHTKLGNNHGYREWQIRTETGVPNLYAAGTSVSVHTIPFNTETATTSGMHAAFTILEAHAPARFDAMELQIKKREGYIQCHRCRQRPPRPMGRLFGPLRRLDGWLFARGWPSLIDVMRLSPSVTQVREPNVQTETTARA